MTVPPGTRRVDRTKRTLVLAGVIMAVAGSVVTSWALTRRAAVYAEADRYMLTLEAIAHEADTLLWQAILMDAIDPGAPTQLADHLHDELHELEESLEEFKELGVERGGVDTSLHIYLSTMEDQSSLLDGDDVDRAVAHAQGTVASAFADLDGRIDALMPIFGSRAAQSRTLADIVAVSTLIFAVATAAIATAWLRRLTAAEQIVANKDRFIASVSHELRTPLTAVVGLSQALIDYEDTEPAALRSLLSDIAVQSQEVSYLVEDLLVAARSEIDQVSIRPETFDLGSEVVAMVERMRSVTAKRTTITVDRQVEAVADPLRVRQILRNLLVNADRYGGPEIAVVVSAKRAMARVEIRDSGPPLDPSAREQMFMAYQRTSPGIPTGSLGLGLTVSLDLAERMGGTLTYDHTMGWSVFTLTLPVAEGGSRRLEVVKAS